MSSTSSQSPSLSFKSRLKVQALSALKTAGMFHLVRNSSWRRQRVTILCYHGFSLDDEHEWNSYLYMSPSMFESRLQMLKSGGYNVLPLGEAVDRLYKNLLPPKSVVITIDDGTYDCYRQALPLLKKYGFPATIYLTTYQCFYNEPLFAIACSYLLWESKRTELDMAPLTGENAIRQIEGVFPRHAAVTELSKFADGRGLSAADKTSMLQQLASQVGVDYQHFKSQRKLHVMNPEEVRDAARQGFDIQLHTHRHRTPLDRDLFLKEIRDNREKIIELTGVNPVHFCYPSGVYDKEFLPWLRESQVISSTTCKVDLASSGQNPLLLPRLIDTQAKSALQVQSWLSGIGSLLPRADYYSYSDVSE